MTALLDIGADVDWTDAEAAAEARRASSTTPSGVIAGRIGELIEWLAATQGHFPPRPPARVRWVSVGTPSAAARELAATLDIGVREVEPGGGLAAGTEAADDEADRGTGLVVLAGPSAGTPAAIAAAVTVSLFTGVEPVAVLPRGQDATDTAAWIAQAVTVRDTRRAVEALRLQPDDLLTALDCPALAATAAFAMRSAARRTPVVLDGAMAVAAALLGYEIQPRAARWWQLADTSRDPVHTLAAERLGRRPLLDLEAAVGHGTSGLLAVAVLRAAAIMAGSTE